MRGKYQAWVNEVDFFISLDQRVALMAQRRKLKFKKAKLQRLRQYTHKMQISRARNQDITKYANRKL